MKSNRILIGLTAALVALLALAAAGNAFADSLAVDITTGALIQNADASELRLLLRFDLPPQLASMEIVFAELRAPMVSVIPDSSALAINCYPLRIAWDPDNIVWDDLGDSLLSEEIGDDGTLFATSAQGEQEAYFDITSIVRSWADSSMSNNGLVFFCDDWSQPYFLYDRQEGSPFATVRIIYTRQSP